MDQAKEARRLLLSEGAGVLSTISQDVPGYPFGSVTPYCVDRQCQPVIYISHIAQHTKNILKDPRVCLTVLEGRGDGDVQAEGRITCLADARLIEESESDVRDRYFRFFPATREYEQTHSFSFFRLDLVRVRFIGGFGRIFWLEPGEFKAPNPFSEVQESRILQHMNQDHGDALRRFADGVDATMVGIDAEGFDLLADGRRVRRPFATPVHNLEDARQALVAMAKRPA